MFPETLMVGMEIRVKVSDYVTDRITALRSQHPGRYTNVACLRSNAMKYSSVFQWFFGIIVSSQVSAQFLWERPADQDVLSLSRSTLQEGQTQVTRVELMVNNQPCSPQGGGLSTPPCLPSMLTFWEWVEGFTLSLMLKTFSSGWVGKINEWTCKFFISMCSNL